MATTRTQKTVLNVKIDTNLKKDAQKLAKSIGLPLSTIVNRLLEQFIIERTITFEEPLAPNTHTAKTIDQARADYKAGKTAGPFKTIDEMFDYLDA